MGRGGGAGGRRRVVLDDSCSRSLVKLLGQVQTALGLRVPQASRTVLSLLALLRYPFRRAAASRLLSAGRGRGRARGPGPRRSSASARPSTRCSWTRRTHPRRGGGGAAAPRGRGDPEGLRDLHNVARLITLLGGTTDEAVQARLDDGGGMAVGGHPWRLTMPPH